MKKYILTPLSMAVAVLGSMAFASSTHADGLRIVYETGHAQKPIRHEPIMVVRPMPVRTAYILPEPHHRHGWRHHHRGWERKAAYHRGYHHGYHDRVAYGYGRWE